MLSLEQKIRRRERFLAKLIPLVMKWLEWAATPWGNSTWSLRDVEDVSFSIRAHYVKDEPKFLVESSFEFAQIQIYCEGHGDEHRVLDIEWNGRWSDSVESKNFRVQFFDQKRPWKSRVMGLLGKKALLSRLKKEKERQIVQNQEHRRKQNKAEELAKEAKRLGF